MGGSQWAGKMEPEQGVVRGGRPLGGRLDSWVSIALLRYVYKIGMAPPGVKD